MATHLSKTINGRYELGEILGRGASSVVYRTRDLEAPDQPLALKVLHSQRSEDNLARLTGEYEMARATSHPGLVRIFDLAAVSSGPENIIPGSVFLVEELIEGRFLDLGMPADWSPRKKVSILWKVLLDGASVLDSLHRVGLLHRDVKPANLVLCNDRVRLCDLGLAAPAFHGLPGGTPGFIAPEVLTGLVDARSDLYGLAASVYWLATRRHPRSRPGADASTLLTDSLYGELVPLRTLAPWVPAGMAQIIEQVLDRNPNLRPTSASQLLDWAQRKTRTRPLWDLSPRQRPRRPLFPPKLTGRSAQLTRILDLVESQNQVGPTVVLLMGLDGVGRHRLATEALVRLKVRHAIRRSRKASSEKMQRQSQQDLWVLDGDWAKLFSKICGRHPNDPSGLPETHGPLATTPDAQAASLAGVLAGKDNTTRSVLLVRDAHQPHVIETIARLASFAHEKLASTYLLVPVGEQQAAVLPKKPWVVRVRLSPLDESESRQLLESMAGESLDPKFTQLIHKLAEGLPAKLVELLQAAWEAAPPGKAIEEEVLSRGFEARELLQFAVEKMPPADKEILACLSILGAKPGSGVALEQLRRVMSKEGIEACLAGLHGRGLVDWTASGPTVTQPTIADMAFETLNRSRKAELERQSLALLDALLKNQDSGRDDPTPWLWTALGRLARRHRRRGMALSALSKAADAFSERGESDRAFQVAREALDLRKNDETTVRWAARHAATAGHYDQALALLQRWESAPKPRVDQSHSHSTAPGKKLSAQGILDKAEYLRRAGKQRQASQLFRILLTGKSLDRSLVGRVQAGLARTLLETGRTDEAVELVENSPPIDRDDTDVAWLESRAMVLFYAGRSSEALTSLDRARAICRGKDAHDRLARILGLAGMIRQQDGDMNLAEASYEEALRLAKTSGDIHSMAVYDANLGAVLLDKGMPDRAVDHLASAAKTLRILGLEDHFSSAVYNLATAWLRLGDIPAAAREVSAGLEAVSTPLALAYLKMLQSEVLQRLRSSRDDTVTQAASTHIGSWPASPLEPALDALHLLSDLHATARLTYAWANLVLIAAAASQTVPRRNEAVHALRKAFRAPETMVRATAAHALLVLLHRERQKNRSIRHSAAEDLFGATFAEIIDKCRRLVDDLEHSGARELAWRLSLRAGLCAESPQRDLLVESARNIFSELLANTDISHKIGRESDPEVALLSAASASVLAETPSAPPGGPAPAFGSSRHSTKEDALVLQRLLEVTRRLAEERRLDTLLSFILDVVIDLTGAERGFLLLAGEDGLEVGAQRRMDAEASDSKTRWSHSIAKRAMDEAAPVLTLDALDDRRFAESGSVMNLKLRSVLAVPLIARSTPVGTLYVDNRMRRGAFTERDAELALSFADQAAAAIQTARLLELAEQRRREIERLNEQLARRLEQAETHIQTLRTEVASARMSLVDDDRYGQLVGRSRAMQDVFDLIERVSATDLPVVILGESGTGKELVAKAIHNKSLRAQGPFASENCGAVTESLLESLLFGHEKGAFTGASRRQKGLFEIAHRGTLFLDEVGEMSPAMQVKLLRVLQDGIFRRVGGHSSVSVDVRVVAASNKDIESMVEEGTFRRDLFYRLAVVLVRVPPLRNRTGDIPLLVEHFVRRHASPGRVLSVEREAMQALMSYDWPGNVRQLENEIMRIVALSRGPITLADLSPAIAAGHHDAMPATLDLRANVAALEKRLIRTALQQTGGNRSRAADILGLSRYGLLKKLRRHGIDDPGHEPKRNGS